VAAVALAPEAEEAVDLEDLVLVLVVAADAPLETLLVAAALPVVAAADSEENAVLAALADAALADTAEVEAAALEAALEDEPDPALTSVAAVLEPSSEVQKPAPTLAELSIAPTWPLAQQKPLPSSFLYKDQVVSAQVCTDAPSTAPMQLEEVGQQAAATD